MNFCAKLDRKPTKKKKKKSIQGPISLKWIEGD